MKDFLIQKDDVKTQNWSQSFKKMGLNLIPQKGSAIKGPFFLILYIIKNQRKPFGYIVRYLNDYSGLFKTLSRFFSEVFLIFLCQVFGIKLFWICHNVDRESEAYFPFLSKTRRNLFAGFSQRIFVTDQLLIEKAIEIFPRFKSKIDFVTFGAINNENNEGINEYEQELAELIQSKRDSFIKDGQHFKVLFCAGMPKSEKSIHFDFLLELLEKAKANGIYLQAIVSGDFKDSERGDYLLKKFKGNEHIYLFENYTQFSHKFIDESVDFYWRGYTDFSVPYSVFESATMKKPVLVLNNGFFSQFIKYYRLGLAIDLNFSDFSEIFEKIGSEKFYYDEFLESHKWDVLAEKIEGFK